MNSHQDFPTGDLQLQLSSTNLVRASVSHEAPRGTNNGHYGADHLPAVPRREQ